MKLAKELVKLADEAIEIEQTRNSSPPEKVEYYSGQLQSVFKDQAKVVSEYGHEFLEIAEKGIKKAEKVRVLKTEIKEFAKKYKKKKKVTKKYRVYKSNFYSKISNFFMEDLSFYIANKYPERFRRLSEQLTFANMKILSRTYLSVILFSTLITFPILTALVFLFTFNILIALGSGILGSVLVFLSMYGYPSYEKKNRAKLMDQELVFAFFHMSAVASSGAPPIKIFKLLLESREYKNLESEFERILNYINVFGYNLTTSLKTVAATTPSQRFKDFLYGVASNIETGGGIKEYLKGKSEDELVKSRLEQQRYLETVSTFSEIYIGVLIAAPLLFIVTLAILERISPDFMGISISTMAMVGVFLLLPILNAVFILLFETSKVGK
jgi:archaellum biogenesis protein FlaJ (TadC family)